MQIDFGLVAREGAGAIAKASRLTNRTFDLTDPLAQSLDLAGGVPARRVLSIVLRRIALALRELVKALVDAVLCLLERLREIQRPLQHGRVLGIRGRIEFVRRLALHKSPLHLSQLVEHALEPPEPVQPLLLRSQLSSLLEQLLLTLTKLRDLAQRRAQLVEPLVGVLHPCKLLGLKNDEDRVDRLDSPILLRQCGEKLLVLQQIPDRRQVLRQLPGVHDLCGVAQLLRFVGRRLLESLRNAAHFRGDTGDERPDRVLVSRKFSRATLGSLRAADATEHANENQRTNRRRGDHRHGRSPRRFPTRPPRGPPRAGDYQLRPVDLATRAPALEECGSRLRLKSPSHRSGASRLAGLVRPRWHDGVLVAGTGSGLVPVHLGSSVLALDRPPGVPFGEEPSSSFRSFLVSSRTPCWRCLTSRMS